MAKEINGEMVKAVKDFLKPDGRAYFLKELLANDTLDHLHLFGGGMEVRNFLRGTDLCNDWTDCDFDNNWEAVVMKAIADDVKSEEMFIQGE